MGNHNPLSILRDCLSDGVHNLSDEERLRLDPKGRAALVALIERIALETELAIVLTVTQSLRLSTGDFISEKEVSGFLDTVA